MDDDDAAIRAARAAARLASLTAALRAATGSTLAVVGPLINWIEMDAPGGRWRAYLARRASMPLHGRSVDDVAAAAAAIAIVAADDDGDDAAATAGGGGGRLREVFAMVEK